MTQLNWGILFPLILYLCGMYVVTIWLSRNKGMLTSGGFIEDYFLGSRGMGAFILALTLMATYTSGSSFLGGPGMAYKMGLGWVLLAMIQVPTALLTLGVLGKRFAIIARRIHAVTLNDFLRARYQSPFVVVGGALSILLFSCAAMSAQFIAGGRLLESVTGLPYGIALLLFAGTVVLYTTFGGFRAVVLTDAIQGVIMVGGTLLLLYATLRSGGGIAAIVGTLKEIDPDLLSPTGPAGFISQPFILSFWLLVGFGVIGLPFSSVRCMGYKNSKAMHRGIIISSVVLTVVMLGMHLTGALGRAVMPGIEQVDRVIPEMALRLLSPVLAGIFLAGPLAAIMSSVDSQLILASAAIVKDLYINHIAGESGSLDEGKIKRLSFLTTAFLGSISFLIAFNPPSVIVWINLFAFGGLEAAFLLPTLLGLYWKRANAAGAMASMLTGVCSFIGISQITSRVLGMHVIVPSIALALFVFVLVSLITKPPSPEIINIFWGHKRLPESSEIDRRSFRS